MRRKFITVPIIALLAIVVAIPLLFSGSSVRAASEAEIETAVGNGLAWLATQQKGDGHFESDATIGAHAAATCLALVKFEDRALELGFSSPFDVGYQYHQEVEDGLDYVFGEMTVAGDFVHVYGQNYETGICMMAVAASAEPDRVSTVDSKTFKQVLEGMMAWMEDAQNDSDCRTGGWGYVPNDPTWSDQSNSGYSTLGIGFAARMGVYPQATTLDKLETFVDNIQHPTSGGSGYEVSGTPPCGSDEGNILRTGNLLYEMALVGRSQLHASVEAAIDFIENNWNAGAWDGWQGGLDLGNYQAMFTMMKGLEAYGVDTLDAGIGDWFDVVSSYIVGEQDPGDYWTGTGHGTPDYVLETSWALLTLEKTLEAPPVAGVGGIVQMQVDSSASPASLAEGSGSSSLPYAAIAGAAAAAAVVLSAGALYARRRWVR